MIESAEVTVAMRSAPMLRPGQTTPVDTHRASTS